MRVPGHSCQECGAAALPRYLASALARASVPLVCNTKVLSVVGVGVEHVVRAWSGRGPACCGGSATVACSVDINIAE